MQSKDKFEMVGKTFQGLEEVLAEELRGLGAENVMPGRRMVSFEGDMEMLYRANMCCRTALRILKPICRFMASDPDDLYEKAKEYDWSRMLNTKQTFAIDSVVNGDDFPNSRYVTYRVKDAIVDWFKDRSDERPSVRLQDADVMINVHIAAHQVTLSLDSSGESLHKRGWRVAQTEAPINEVLAAGIILLSGWRGDAPFVDPMCGSGTFLVEAAMIAAGINPGVYRRRFAFESWPDFDRETFEKIYNDDSSEKTPAFPIIGCDISPRAIDIASRNLKSAGLAKYVNLQVRPIARWTEAPAEGVLVTNPPYGERISVDDMAGLYKTLGSQLKHIFKGYHAWVIGYRDEYFDAIGLAPSTKLTIMNGGLQCELREYVIFEGDYRTFRREGGSIRKPSEDEPAKSDTPANDGRRHGDYRRDDRRGNDRRREGRSFDRPHRDDRRTPGERYAERFRRDDRSFDRPRHDDRRADRRPRTDRPSRPDRPTRFEASPDNPLAGRRNEDALRMLQGRRPSLPQSDGPLMRPRRVWKKGGNHTDDETNRES